MTTQQLNKLQLTAECDALLGKYNNYYVLDEFRVWYHYFYSKKLAEMEVVA